MIFCDWGPGQILTNAAKRAGFDAYDRLPVKMIMWINPDGIKVQLGYRAKIVKLETTRIESVFVKIRQMINDWTKTHTRSS